MAQILEGPPEVDERVARRGPIRETFTWEKVGSGRRSAILGRLARRLGEEIADAADADQWAIAVVGLKQTGRPDFEELVPRSWLEALNSGQPARYRLTLVLHWGQVDLGIVRLGTLRPSGFSHNDVSAARVVTEVAAAKLASAIETTAERRESAPPSVNGRQGLMVIDAQHRVRLVSPGIPGLLNWRPDDLAGRPCAPILACRDEADISLCGHCGVDTALQRRGHVQASIISIADRHGGRRRVRASYWHVPAAGADAPPSVIALLQDAGPDRMGQSTETGD